MIHVLTVTIHTPHWGGVPVLDTLEQTPAASHTHAGRLRLPILELTIADRTAGASSLSPNESISGFF
jgi:hypothetical protein